MAMSLGSVYTPRFTFRAEKSFTTRHAAEFWLIEPGDGLCDLKGYMDTAEAMTKFVIRYVLVKKNNKKFQFPVEWGVDIRDRARKRYLTEASCSRSPSLSPITPRRSRAST